MVWSNELMMAIDQSLNSFFSCRFMVLILTLSLALVVIQYIRQNTTKDPNPQQRQHLGKLQAHRPSKSLDRR